MRREFTQQLIAALITAFCATAFFVIAAREVDPTLAWTWSLALAGSGHLIWLFVTRKKPWAKALLLPGIALLLEIGGNDPQLATLLIAAAYLGLRHHWFGENMSSRRFLYSAFGGTLAFLAACWLGGFTAIGLAIGCWTWLLILACTDLLIGTAPMAKTEDAFTKAATALEQSLRYH